jgi:predicted enzyme related to lactoylglutathione lyase
MTAATTPDNVAVWFEIPALDFDRAVGFYEKVFETSLIRENMAGSELAVFPHDKAAASGCVIKGEGYRPAADGAVVYLRSRGDLAGPLARAAKSGGKVVTPKTALPPGMGFFAHFVDSEGNRVGLHSME